MNKNIEDIIKDALENHDAGYVTGAWEKMSARLDGTPPTPFYKKWWMAAAFGTVLVGSAAYFLSSENKETATDKAATPMTAVTTSSVSDNSATKSERLNGNSTTLNADSEVLANPNDKNSASQPEKIFHGGGSASCGGGSFTNKGTSGIPAGNPGNTNPQKTNPNPIITDVTDTYKKVSVPTEMCANDDLMIGNPNTAKFITVTDINGKTIDLAPGKKVTLKPKSQGTITVQSGDHKDIIAVHENTAKLYIDVDPSILYENGIPTLKFKVPGMKENLDWSSNIKGTEQKGDTYIVHPYVEKNIEVKVTSTNEYGCSVSETQVVSIQETYNLMAPSGFRPNSGDIQTNTFMPYALTQRNVNFELVVLDPRTGAVVFSSSDATQGWDGIDKRTGEMVKENSVWAWKVVIKNPNVGEPVEYKGTITRM